MLNTEICRHCLDKNLYLARQDGEIWVKLMVPCKDDAELDETIDADEFTKDRQDILNILLSDWLLADDGPNQDMCPYILEHVVSRRSSLLNSD
jgi:hypothetical protein